MRISIDSDEPLEDVLRVVGAAYDVTLVATAQKGHADSDGARRPTRGTRRRAQGASTPRGNTTKGRARKKPARRTRAASNAEMRAWARQNGYTISDRGRIPAAVVAGYQAAN